MLWEDVPERADRNTTSAEGAADARRVRGVVE